MIRVSIFSKDGRITGFSCIGHAGYETEGKDIICAGVSALVINAVNSIESLTKAKFQVEEKDGDIRFVLEDTSCPESQLLLKSMQLGLETIENDCGSQYVKVTIVS